MLPNYEHAKTLFEGYGLELTPECYDKLDCYASFLVEYNENVNLTALTAPEDVLVKHFLDSMLLTKYIEITWAQPSLMWAPVPDSRPCPCCFYGRICM